MNGIVGAVRHVHELVLGIDFNVVRIPERPLWFVRESVAVLDAGVVGPRERALVDLALAGVLAVCHEESLVESGNTHVVVKAVFDHHTAVGGAARRRNSQADHHLVERGDEDCVRVLPP